MGIENGYNGFNHQTYIYANKINCPVLMEWGDKDVYVTSEETNGIYKSLKSSNKKLLVYAGANHESLLKYDPIQWQKNIKEFLNTLPH
jgi:alpha-beta hydrolase superfamily lysophospholipase